jgi:hypothetical protein
MAAAAARRVLSLGGLLLDARTLFGLFAVTAMLFCYALEGRSLVLCWRSLVRVHSARRSS